MTQYFTETETWLGGSYQLAIELGSRSDERLLAALSAVTTFKDRNFKYLAPSIRPLSVCIVRERLKNAPKSRFIRAFLGAENRPLQVVGRLLLHRLQDVRIDIFRDAGSRVAHPG